MWDQWSRLLIRGKNPEPMIGPLIHLAKLWVRYDRKIAGAGTWLRCLRLPGWHATATTVRAGQGQPDRPERPDNAWIDWTVDAGADDPADWAAALEAAGLTSEDLAA